MHYLIDLFSSPTSSAPVVDVAEPANGQTLINGTFVVRVPEFVGIVPPLPSTLGNLLTKKYSGLLSFYAGFSNIVYDDLLDDLGVDYTASPRGTFGVRGNIGIRAGTVLQSVATPLVGTPESAVFTWEVFTYTDVDPKAGLLTRTYNQLATAAPTTSAMVSFNGGSTYTAAIDGAAITIPPADQGSSLVVQISNDSASKLYIGSWALIYG